MKKELFFKFSCLIFFILILVGVRVQASDANFKVTNFDECITYVKNNPNGFLATIDKKQPHVRPMTVWLADKTGFYFYTSKVKNVYAQLAVYPVVEIAFHEPGVGKDPGTILRIAGKVEFVNDLTTRQKLWALCPWLNEVGTPEKAPTIAIFRISQGKFNFWTWENNIKPGPWVSFP